MEHTTLIPEDLYTDFAAYAQHHGKSPDEALLELVRDVVEHEEQVEPTSHVHSDNGMSAPDPLAPFIGAFTFDRRDVAEKHDQYLAEAYADNHENEQ